MIINYDSINNTKITLINVVECNLFVAVSTEFFFSTESTEFYMLLCSCTLKSLSVFLYINLKSAWYSVNNTNRVRHVECLSLERSPEPVYEQS